MSIFTVIIKHGGYNTLISEYEANTAVEAVIEALKDFAKTHPFKNSTAFSLEVYEE